jgi:hypothetical protein
MSWRHRLMDTGGSSGARAFPVGCTGSQVDRDYVCDLTVQYVFHRHHLLKEVLVS